MYENRRLREREKKNNFQQLIDLQLYEIKWNHMRPNEILIYFPIQKLAKIFPKRSSLVISPVISPK